MNELDAAIAELREACRTSKTKYINKIEKKHLVLLLFEFQEKEARVEVLEKHLDGVHNHSEL